jgi:hypothetical protein
MSPAGAASLLCVQQSADDDRENRKQGEGREEGESGLVEEPNQLVAHGVIPSLPRWAACRVKQRLRSPGRILPAASERRCRRREKAL